eukprot:Colp12_sorted_trinity150504_noHs@6354
MAKLLTLMGLFCLCVVVSAQWKPYQIYPQLWSTTDQGTKNRAPQLRPNPQMTGTVADTCLLLTSNVTPRDQLTGFVRLLTAWGISNVQQVMTPGVNLTLENGNTGLYRCIITWPTDFAIMDWPDTQRSQWLPLDADQWKALRAYGNKYGVRILTMNANANWQDGFTNYNWWFNFPNTDLGPMVDNPRPIGGLFPTLRFGFSLPGLQYMADNNIPVTQTIFTLRNVWVKPATNAMARGMQMPVWISDYYSPDYPIYNLGGGRQPFPLIPGAAVAWHGCEEFLWFAQLPLNQPDGLAIAEILIRWVINPPGSFANPVGQVTISNVPYFIPMETTTGQLVNRSGINPQGLVAGDVIPNWNGDAPATTSTSTTVAPTTTSSSAVPTTSSTEATSSSVVAETSSSVIAETSSSEVAETTSSTAVETASTTDATTTDQPNTVSTSVEEPLPTVTNVQTTTTGVNGNDRAVDSANKSSGSSLSDGAVIGIAIGGGCGVALVALLIAAVIRRKSVPAAASAEKPVATQPAAVDTAVAGNV